VPAKRSHIAGLLFASFASFLFGASLAVPYRADVSAKPAPVIANAPVSQVASASSTVSSSSVSILGFGDLMLDRNVFTLSEKSGSFAYPFTKIDPYIKSSNADIVFANLEGPITASSSVAVNDNGMRFTFNPSFVPELASRFTALCIGNNHIMDFGQEGFLSTRKFLSDAGIKFFGEYANRGDDLSTIVSKNGIRIAFVSYDALPDKNLSNILIEIKRLKDFSDFIIVMPHWGIEYANSPSDKQKEDAKALIDAGANAIIGSHPHVIQPVGEYKNVPIFYSLGNFVFDQYFSKDTMKGLSVIANLTKDAGGHMSASYSLKPIAIGKDSRPELISDTDAAPIFASMSAASDVPDDLKSAIRSGVITPETLLSN
jgi:poly-gamma-glutamate synthesis protein (capsule biosynthesis protein)